MKRLLMILFCVFLFSGYSSGQNIETVIKMDNRARNTADTSKFSTNMKDGWMIYSAYTASKGADSILFEVTLRHNRDIDWSQFQLIGRIKDKSLQPAQTQEVNYKLLADTYTVKVDEKGRCFVRLVNGQIPPGDPVIVPIQISFRKTAIF